MAWVGGFLYDIKSMVWNIYILTKIHAPAKLLHLYVYFSSSCIRPSSPTKFMYFRCNLLFYKPVQSSIGFTNQLVYDALFLVLYIEYSVIVKQGVWHDMVNPARQ